MRLLGRRNPCKSNAVTSSSPSDPGPFASKGRESEKLDAKNEGSLKCKSDQGTLLQKSLQSPVASGRTKSARLVLAYEPGCGLLALLLCNIFACYFLPWNSPPPIPIWLPPSQLNSLFQSDHPSSFHPKEIHKYVPHFACLTSVFASRRTSWSRMILLARS